MQCVFKLSFGYTYIRDSQTPHLLRKNMLIFNVVSILCYTPVYMLQHISL